jgi:hypothetical protein
MNFYYFQKSPEQKRLHGSSAIGGDQRRYDVASISAQMLADSSLRTSNTERFDFTEEQQTDGDDQQQSSINVRLLYNSP